jgi:hypothetical protein
MKRHSGAVFKLVLLEPERLRDLPPSVPFPKLTRCRVVLPCENADCLGRERTLNYGVVRPSVACLGNPDPGDMKVYCPTGKETFDDDETTEEAPS